VTPSLNVEQIVHKKYVQYYNVQKDKLGTHFKIPSFVSIKVEQFGIFLSVFV